MANKAQKETQDQVDQAKSDATEQENAQNDVQATELSRKELVNEAVDQETGEVKLGQPGGTEGQAASDRPTMTEEQAREINGYAGFKNIGEQIEADPTRKTDGQSDVIYRKG